MRLIALALLLLTACGSSQPDPGDDGQPLTGERTSIFTHCGFYEIEVDGTVWTPESIERGAYPEGTGFNVTEGIASVVGEKLLFRADSGLEVTFVPAPDGLPPVPGCD